MHKTWNERVDAFWDSADDGAPEEALAAMRALVEERASDDPEAIYEWASVHDFLDREDEAVALYRTSLELGLDGARRPQALVQLASTLRNVGRPAEALEILDAMEEDDIVGSAKEAFKALILFDLGEKAAALRTALDALAPTLPLYKRSVTNYAAALTDEA